MLVSGPYVLQKSSIDFFNEIFWSSVYINLSKYSQVSSYMIFMSTHKTSFKRLVSRNKNNKHFTVPNFNDPHKNLL